MEEVRAKLLRIEVRGKLSAIMQGGVQIVQMSAALLEGVVGDLVAFLSYFKLAGVNLLANYLSQTYEPRLILRPLSNTLDRRWCCQVWSMHSSCTKSRTILPPQRRREQYHGVLPERYSSFFVEAFLFQP